MAMNNAVIYVRFSPRPGADQCQSNLRQFQRCRAYCQAHDYRVVGVRWDRELSGGRADNRPGLQRALAQACEHKAVLVVYKLDRLARNTRDALNIADRLHSAKADLASATEQLDTRSPMGKAFFTIMAVFAELERAQIVARTSDIMRQHQANGRRMTRADCCPYGWKPDPADPACLIEDAAEQTAVARIKEERAAGCSYREIARLLDWAGMPCRGKRWSPSTVRAILARGSEPTALTP
jgi:site-specific DNA recombinase